MDFESLIEELRAERQSMLLEILELRERCKLLSDENESYVDEIEILKDELQGTREALRQSNKLSEVRREELEASYERQTDNEKVLQFNADAISVFKSQLKKANEQIEAERQSYSALARLLDDVRAQRDAGEQFRDMYFALRDGINAAMADKQ